MNRQIIDLLKEAENNCNAAEETKNVVFLRVAREQVQDAIKLAEVENA